MGFIQAIFLAGAASFAIPVAIHLIYKLRKKRLVFSSLLFVRQSVLRETSRLRLRDLILLLLRCAACILIALAFARPYRPGQVLAGGTGEPRQALVIVLDDSPSMQAQDGSATRWQLALERAAKLVEDRKPGDRAGLVLASDPARPEIELSGNFGATLAALKGERPSPRRGDLAQALRTGLDLLADATEPVRRVVLLSDMQANQVDRGAWADAAQRAALARHPVKIELASPYADGRTPPRLPNLAVTAVRAKSDVWVEGQPLRLGVRIENFGDGEATGIAVRLLADEKELGKRTVGLGPRSGTEIELEAAFPRPGEAAGRIEVAAHDALPEDDRRWFALRLRDSVKALVCEDTFREADSYLDQSYYLRLALDPTPRGAEGAAAGMGAVPARGYVRVQPVTPNGLTPAALQDADAVFLCGASELPPQALAALEEAVKNGLDLAIFMGRGDGRINETFYAGAFFKEGKGLLPARPGSMYEGNLRENRYNGLDAFQAGHAVFKPFEPPLDKDLRLPRFLRHYRVDPADLAKGAPERPEGKVLATFNEGSPLLAERAYGKGKVLLFPFIPRPVTDTDLPVKKVFVPLVHQVVRYFAGIEGVSRRNLTVGETLEPADAGVPPEMGGELATPMPASELVQLKGGESATVAKTGVYTLTYRRGERAEKALWAVNLDPQESDLKSEDLAALQAVFASNPAGPAPGVEEGIRLGNQSSAELKAQAPDWRYFLVAALACLLLEVIVRDFWER